MEFILVTRSTYFSPPRLGQPLHLATEADKQTQMTIVQPVTEALEFGAEGLISGDACFFEVLPMDKAVFEALPKSIF